MSQTCIWNLFLHENQSYMNIVIFSGAGISAESGIATFRDSGGLWENYNIEEVATPEAFQKNPELVLDFYNQRRRQIATAEPNAAHLYLKELEKIANTTIITQNIDDLHERSGSKNVVHLHGLITQAKSSYSDQHVQDIGFNDIRLGDHAADGSQLRPNIVWFGEAVPMLDKAIQIVRTADILITIGTSLNVYPAAGLIYETKSTCKNYVIDPNMNSDQLPPEFSLIKEKATIGAKELVHSLTNQSKNW